MRGYLGFAAELVRPRDDRPPALADGFTGLLIDVSAIVSWLRLQGATE
jgi:hypothetical protein